MPEKHRDEWSWTRLTPGRVSRLVVSRFAGPRDGRGLVRHRGDAVTLAVENCVWWLNLVQLCLVLVQLGLADR